MVLVMRTHPLQVSEGTAPGPALQTDQVIVFEIQSYLRAGTLDTEEDPLKWGKKPWSRGYPRLSNPATSAYSERVFSTGIFYF